MSELRLFDGNELYLAALSMDLQWFAAEDEGRTFEPTDTTYRKAREEGRVAKSQELTAALGLLIPGVTVVLLAPWMLRTCVEMLRFFFTRVNELEPMDEGLTALIFGRYFLQLALPVLVVAVITALFSNIVQVGFLFTTKPLGPDFSKVLPRFGRYFQRIMFSPEALFNLAKSFFKLLIIGAVAYILISSRFSELANLQTAGLWNGLSLVASLAAQLLIICSILLLVLSIPDIYFQRWQFRQSLKMTPQAFKEEQKQEDGDPEVRQRLKTRYREVLSRSMLNAVPDANVVITNPTHFSVALQYDLGMEAPKVIAKGEDELAFRIRDVARENGVPVVRHPYLTRALYFETALGDTIPYKYWNVVILVLKEFLLYDKNQRDKKQRRKQAYEEQMGA